MPAPTQAALEAAFKKALLAKGYAKGSYVNGAFTQDATSLPPDLQSIVSALAVGLSEEWGIWQSTTVVVVPATSPTGTPSTGIIQ